MVVHSLVQRSVNDSWLGEEKMCPFQAMGIYRTAYRPQACWEGGSGLRVRPGLTGLETHQCVSGPSTVHTCTDQNDIVYCMWYMSPRPSLYFPKYSNKLISINRSSGFTLHVLDFKKHNHNGLDYKQAELLLWGGQVFQGWSSHPHSSNLVLDTEMRHCFLGYHVLERAVAGV